MTTETDVLDAVAAANLQHATSWELAGPLFGGAQSGAWRLRSAGGGTAVLKLALTPDWAEQVLRAERAVTLVRAAGYPTPAWLSTGRTAAGLGYQIQELVTGRSLRHIRTGEAKAVIEVLEAQAGLDPDPDRCWSDFLEDGLGDGLPDLRTGARAAGAAGNRLLAACDRLLQTTGHVQLPCNDMVHGDFRPANILFDHGTVSGVIDIEAIGSGTRVFDYATFLDHPDIDTDALQLIVMTAAGIAGPAVLRACFARVALDLASFIYAADLPLNDQQRITRVEGLTERADTIHQLLA